MTTFMIWPTEQILYDFTAEEIQFWASVLYNIFQWIYVLFVI